MERIVNHFYCSLYYPLTLFTIGDFYYLLRRQEFSSHSSSEIYQCFVAPDFFPRVTIAECYFNRRKNRKRKKGHSASRRVRLAHTRGAGILSRGSGIEVDKSRPERKSRVGTQFPGDCDSLAQNRPVYARNFRSATSVANPRRDVCYFP